MEARGFDIDQFSVSSPPFDYPTVEFVNPLQGHVRVVRDRIRFYAEPDHEGLEREGPEKPFESLQKLQQHLLRWLDS